MIRREAPKLGLSLIKVFSTTRMLFGSTTPSSGILSSVTNLTIYHIDEFANSPNRVHKFQGIKGCFVLRVENRVGIVEKAGYG